MDLLVSQLFSSSFVPLAPVSVGEPGQAAVLPNYPTCFQSSLTDTLYKHSNMAYLSFVPNCYRDYTCRTATLHATCTSSYVKLFRLGNGRHCRYLAFIGVLRLVSVAWLHSLRHFYRLHVIGCWTCWIFLPIVTWRWHLNITLCRRLV